MFAQLLADLECQIAQLWKRSLFSIDERFLAITGDAPKPRSLLLNVGCPLPNEGQMISIAAIVRDVAERFDRMRALKRRLATAPMTSNKKP